MAGRGGWSSPVACPSQEERDTTGQCVSASLHPRSLPAAQGEGQASSRVPCPVRPAFSSDLRMVSWLGLTGGLEGGEWRGFSAPPAARTGPSAGSPGSSRSASCHTDSDLIVCAPRRENSGSHGASNLELRGCALGPAGWSRRV